MYRLREKHQRLRLVNKHVLRCVVAFILGAISLILLFAYSQVFYRNEQTQSTTTSALPKYVPYHGPMPTKKKNANSSNNSSSNIWFNDQQAQENAIRVHEQRRLYLQTACSGNNKNNDTKMEWFKPPPPPDMTQLPTTEEQKILLDRIKPCRYTLLDLGANVGDSMGKFINAGIPSGSNNQCTGRYSIVDGYIHTTTIPTKEKLLLATWTRDMMKQYTSTHTTRRQTSSINGTSTTAAVDVVQPEKYCYYGLEGNPTFTQQLQTLQQRVLLTQPRPLRHVHFFTETVATGGSDGPTELFLDTVNHKNNYFGSSLLPDHTDVRQSTKKNGGKRTAVTVQGITLTTLLPQIQQRHAGGHMIVKIDIEGAEYALLNEAFNTGILCDYVAAGVRIDIKMEIHPKITIGDNFDLDLFRNINWGKLKECGVNVEVASDAG